MTRIAWLDLETSGLEEAEHSILELACIVTDINLKELGRYHAVVHHDSAQFSPYVYDMHVKSGLLEEIPYGKSIEQVSSEFTKFIKSFGAAKTLHLGGNSVHFDRRFIKKFMPEAEQWLHHRQLDVSSIRLWLTSVFGTRPFVMKTAPHRALNDIEGCISEIKYYNSMVKISDSADLFQSI